MNNLMKQLRETIEQMIATNDSRIKLKDYQPDDTFRFQYYVVDESVFGEVIEVTIYENGNYNIHPASYISPKDGNEVFKEHYASNEKERIAISEKCEEAA